jgi:ribose/xylose/arabinose/galactoside ABC-type transport system permease subunit
MAVTLGGLIALLGLVFVISDSSSITYPNLDVGARLDQPILDIFSIRIFVALAVFALAALCFARTSVGRDLRAIGSDRRASRIAGVRISRLLIGVFAVSGFLAALAGALQGYSLGFAEPDTTVSPLIFATTAALLGGVPLAGGRGNPLGIAAGVLTLGLVIEAVPILRSAEYVNILVPAVLLMIVTIVDAPELKQYWLELRARFVRGSRQTPAPDHQEKGRG